MNFNEKLNRYFSHFGRLLAPVKASVTEGLESLSESPVEAIFSDTANKERMEKTSDELSKLVEKYLGTDPNAAQIVEKIRKEGGETLKRLGDRDPTLLDDSYAGNLLEVVVATDGSRPTFLVRNGKVDRQSSLLGNWGNTLDNNASQIENAIACVGRIDHPGVQIGYMGTGFLIQENLIVTNRHVLQAIANWNGTTWTLASNVAIDFGHEWNAIDSINRRAIRRILFAGSNPIIPSQIDHSKLDLAILEVEPSLAGPVKFFRLLSTSTWNSIGTTVCTLGYPGPAPSGAVVPTLLDQLFQSQFGYKRLAPGEIRIPQVSAPTWTLAHDATTLGGNSGSVIISIGSDGLAAGLHYGGKWSDPRENWGHVLADVLDQKDMASTKTLREILFNEGLNIPLDHEKTAPLAGHFVSTKTNPPTPETSTTGISPTKELVKPIDRAHVVSLKDMIHLGIRDGASRMESTELEAAGDSETPDNELKDRSGYDPNFLTEWPIEVVSIPRTGQSLRMLGTKEIVQCQGSQL